VEVLRRARSPAADQEERAHYYECEKSLRGSAGANIVHKSRCSELAGQVIAKPDGAVADMLKRWLAGEPAPEKPTTLKDAYDHLLSLGLVKVRADFYQQASEILGIPVTAENVASLDQDALKAIMSAELAKTA